MKTKSKVIIICTIILVFCAVMAVIDGILKADYFYKSVVKFVLFLVFPLVYGLFDRKVKIRELFALKKSKMKLSVMLAIGVYIVILGGFLLLRDVFDFSKITDSLTSNIGVNRENFVFVSLYISFVNSLLEEFFFRGFAFLTLKRLTSVSFSYVFSAAAFSVYHVAMMIGWFSPFLFVLVMAGLFSGGLIFNYLNSKSGTVYPSWIVHMFANFAINTVGFILFGII